MAASEDRYRRYRPRPCRYCREPFTPTSPTQQVCRADACQRARRRQKQARYERNGRPDAVALALRDVAHQLVLDAPHSPGFPAAEARWAALLDCRDQQRDPIARIALRACWLDLAAIAVREASKLRRSRAGPPPVNEGQVEALMAATNGGP